MFSGSQKHRIFPNQHGARHAAHSHPPTGMAILWSKASHPRTKITGFTDSGISETVTPISISRSAIPPSTIPISRQNNSKKSRKQRTNYSMKHGAGCTLPKSALSQNAPSEDSTISSHPVRTGSTHPKKDTSMSPGSTLPGKWTQPSSSRWMPVTERPSITTI